MLPHLWGVSFLCLFCFMKEYLYILGAPKECKVILVQKCCFLSNGLGFSLSNSWNNYLRGWEFFNFKFGMICCYDGRTIMFLMLQMTPRFVYPWDLKEFFLLLLIVHDCLWEMFKWSCCGMLGLWGGKGEGPIELMTRRLEWFDLLDTLNFRV